MSSASSGMTPGGRVFKLYLSSGPIPGMDGAWSSMSSASSGMTPGGRVFKLYLSLILSPGRLRVQNFDVWSLEPEQRMWPMGCQARDQIRLSCAWSIAPTSLSTPTFQKNMAPSEPPLQNKSSWKGCHDRQEASFL